MILRKTCVVTSNLQMTSLIGPGMQAALALVAQDLPRIIPWGQVSIIIDILHISFLVRKEWDREGKEGKEKEGMKGNGMKG